MFNDTQIKLLSDPLDPDNVRKRNGAGRQVLSYVEGWHAIDEANRIFGFGCWSRETVLIEPLHGPVLVSEEGHPEKGKVVSCFFAKVKITVWSKDSAHSIVREGCGAARGFAKSAGEAMENAIKAAETDATKRALTTFGYSFGLALYDREQKNVGKPEAQRQIADGASQAPLDQGFDEQPRLSISQRALNGGTGRRTADVGGVPV